MIVRVPFMPAWAWPGTVHSNMYFPGLRLTLIVEVPPPLTTLPVALPTTEMSCGVCDLFCESMVSAPAGAVAFLYW